MPTILPQVFPPATHRLAAVGVKQEHGTPRALQQLPCLRHDLGHEALQVVLLLEDAASEVQQDLHSREMSRDFTQLYLLLRV